SLIAQRRSLPGLSLDALSAEKSFGDLSIRRVREMSIERTQHEDKAFAALPGKCRSNAIIVGSAARDLRPESQCGRYPRRQIMVEGYDDRERFVRSSVTHPKPKFRPLPADDHMPTVGMNSLDGTASELLYVKRPGSEEAVRR